VSGSAAIPRVARPSALARREIGEGRHPAPLERVFGVRDADRLDRMREVVPRLIELGASPFISGMPLLESPPCSDAAAAAEL
jgi:hypothetical protein